MAGKRNGRGRARGSNPLSRPHLVYRRPGRDPRRQPLPSVTALATATGALPLALDAATHDAAVAATSHVPFLAAKGIG